MTICIKDFNCNRWFKKNYGSGEQGKFITTYNEYLFQAGLKQHIFGIIRKCCPMKYMNNREENGYKIHLYSVANL